MATREDQAKIYSIREQIDRVVGEGGNPTTLWDEWHRAIAHAKEGTSFTTDKLCEALEKGYYQYKAEKARRERQRQKSTLQS